MSPDRSIFLSPTAGIQCDHPQVRALAASIVVGTDDPQQAAAELFNFVRDEVAYSPYVPFDRLDDYLALATLERGKGFCVQKAALLCALARAADIPCRLGFAHIRNHQLPANLAQVLGTDVMFHHCYVEWELNGRWRKATPSFERALCQERGWRVVEFQPRADCLLPALDLAGRPHISYLDKLGWREGVPLEEILESWRQGYGEERVEEWRRSWGGGGGSLA